MPKVVKKKRIKILPFIIFIVLVALIVFVINVFLDAKIKNIIIKGNDIVTDQQIIDLAEIGDYPSFYKTTKRDLISKIEKSPFIKEVTINREFYHIFIINVTEYQVLVKKESDGKLILENGEEVTTDQEISYNVPKLTNEVPEDKYEDFLEAMLEINEETKQQISEITYLPNDYDKDRFLLYMDDGNSVYLTLTKFEQINYYNEILPQLDGRKGYLYLDSGNHFQIMQ